MYKKIMIAMAFVCCALIASGQEAPDAKLYVRYNQAYINNLLNNNPEIVVYLNFFVNNSWRIIDKPDKEIDCSKLSKINPETGEILEDPITSEDLEDFNIYRYNYRMDPDKRTYYTLGDTDKILIVLSDNELSKLYKNRQK
ncbi:MAG: hypothetical protein KJ607_06460 [Bacteroidetes bacterium]|nr:hypothetical protein [Bacteroidota bacterium]